MNNFFDERKKERELISIKNEIVNKKKDKTKKKCCMGMLKEDEQTSNSKN
jgi:hypothetical protein